MDKEVLWTDLVGERKTGPKGVHWELRAGHLRNWSFQVNRKDNDSPLKLSFAYRVDNTWIPNPGNPITLAAKGDKDKLHITVLEGDEERILSIDCKIHKFHLSPFSGSVWQLPRAEKIEMEKVLTSGVSKNGVNFILETLGDLNEREAADKEALRKEKQKKRRLFLSQELRREGVRGRNMLEERVRRGRNPRSHQLKFPLQLTQFLFNRAVHTIPLLLGNPRPPRGRCRQRGRQSQKR